MKNMKTIIALLLGATGSAALPIPKAVALNIVRAAAKRSAAAAGEPKKAFALDQTVVQAVVPVEQDDALPAGETRPKQPWEDVPSFLAEQEVVEQRRLADRCERWCAGHSDPWNVRCGWDTNACSGCDECKSCSDTGCCLDWCSTHSEPWNVRCGWSTNDCSACTECCAAPKYVKNNECVACPSGYTCDGATACPSGYKCATNMYVLSNVCTACPDRHTCNGTTATMCAGIVKDNVCEPTAAERAECLAGSEGSCDKCCEGITGVCVELTGDKMPDWVPDDGILQWDISSDGTTIFRAYTFGDKDDCVLLKGNYNLIDGGGGDDAIVVEGDRNSLIGGAGDDALTVVKGNDNYLDGGAGTDTFYIEGVKTQDSKTDSKGNKTKQGSTPLIVGLCVGAAVVVVVLAVVVRKLRGRAAEETSTPQFDAEVQVEA